MGRRPGVRWSSSLQGEFGPEFVGEGDVDLVPAGVRNLYGTSLFVSKIPGAGQTIYDVYTANAGFGALQPKGLFSGHDSTGTCVADVCTAANAAIGQCPSAPMDYPAGTRSQDTNIATAVAGNGVGCPKYTSAQMTSYNNYKLIWTPPWLACAGSAPPGCSGRPWRRAGRTAGPAPGSRLGAGLRLAVTAPRSRACRTAPRAAYCGAGSTRQPRQLGQQQRCA